ncbi:MAG TPA: ABC transporter substrate-binding protein [Actinomycetota bacterium]|nr:ABC transporter substrate-binding protein [Actinomycetota bacterium]
MGSGPYRLVSQGRSKGYIFRANRSYFRGAPAVRTIRVPIVTEADDTIARLERRRLDMVPASLPQETAIGLESGSIAIARGPSYLGTVLMFNVRRAPFDDARIRRAVASVLDLERIARAVGGAVPATRGYLHPESRWAPQAELHRYDRTAAADALSERPVQPARLLVANNDPVRLEAARQVAVALDALNLGIKVTPVSPERLSRRVGETGGRPDFDAAIWSSVPLASYDPAFLQSIFGSDVRRAPANHSGYASKRFDRVVERVATAVDPQKRMNAVEDALVLLARDAPMVPLFFPEGAFAYRPASYDGWVFVKGTGILDKRSFLSAEAPDPTPTPGSIDDPRSDEAVREGGDSLRLISFALLGLVAAMVIGVWLRKLAQRR